MDALQNPRAFAPGGGEDSAGNAGGSESGEGDAGGPCAPKQGLLRSAEGLRTGGRSGSGGGWGLLRLLNWREQAAELQLTLDGQQR